MKILQGLGTSLALTSLLGLAACSKPESTTSTTPPPAAPAAAPLDAPVSATLPANDTAVTTAASLAAAAREHLANFKLPDFQTASNQQLSGLAVQSLSHWVQTIDSPSPALTTEVESLKTALSGAQPVAALGSLSKVGDLAKSIPGGDALLLSAKQLVSAWALKQGFEVSKISGLLGALQKGDLAALASQTLPLLAKGGFSGEQRGILQGVLGTFGIDPGKASGAVDAVKGLLGK